MSRFTARFAANLKNYNVLISILYCDQERRYLVRRVLYSAELRGHASAISSMQSGTC